MRCRIHSLYRGTRRISLTLFSKPTSSGLKHGMMRKLQNDFWSVAGDFIYRHHVEPRVKLYVPRGESFPIPLKYIDVTTNTRTSFHVLLEKNIDDYWNVDGDRELSYTWTGFTRFTILREKPPNGCTWSGRRLTRKQTTSRPDKVVARYVETHVGCIKTQRKAKVGYRKTKTR